ncbi:T9SS type A sorting domain-containing protein [Ferruginibacter profundus]
MIKPLILTCFAVACFNLPAIAIAPGISVVYDSKKKAVNIRWQQKNPGIKSFIIQRSANNSDWADIARQETVNFNPAKTYFFADTKIAAGENYYRLKCITEKGQTEYSASVMVITGTSENSWVMYPVPVRDLLTLQYKGAQKINGVVNVFISNVNGRIITRVRSASLNTIIRIPVDNLGSGIYDVRIIIEDEVVWNQRFVK